MLDVPCLWHRGAGGEEYKNPPKDELCGDTDPRDCEGAESEGMILGDLAEVLVLGACMFELDGRWLGLSTF